MRKSASLLLVLLLTVSPHRLGLADEALPCCDEEVGPPELCCSECTPSSAEFDCVCHGGVCVPPSESYQSCVIVPQVIASLGYTGLTFGFIPCSVVYTCSAYDPNDPCDGFGNVCGYWPAWGPFNCLVVISEPCAPCVAM